MSKLRDVACDRCFHDAELVAWIREHGKAGACPWCDARNAYTVPLVDLGPLFREVAQIYEPSDSGGGDTIGYRLQDDWDVFSDRIERDPDRRDRLAIAILKAGLHPKDDVDEPDYAGLFRDPASELEDQWEGRIEALFRKSPSITSRGSRPMLTDEQYRAMLAISRSLSPLFELALVVAHETGHRIGSVRLLRWSDVDIEHGKIRWRAENDKIAFEHETIVTRTVLDALDRARQEQQAIGDAWVFPAPGDATQPCSRHLVRDWWQRAEVLAGVPRVQGLGWHSLRRKFATELKHTPLKDLCYLGGWKEPQTVLRCYQRPDDVTMREALATRRRLTGLSGL